MPTVDSFHSDDFNVGKTLYFADEAIFQSSIKQKSANIPIGQGQAEAENRRKTKMVMITPLLSLNLSYCTCSCKHQQAIMDLDCGS